MSFFTDQEKLVHVQRQLTVAALIALLSFLLLQIGAFFADLLRILAISLLVSYLVINVVDIFDKLIHNRALAIALVYIVLVGLAVVAGLVVIPAMVYQVTSLINSTVDSIPEFLNRINQAVVPLQHRFHESQIDIKVMDVLSNIATQLPKPDAGAIATRLTDMAMGTMTWVMYGVSISVTTFYFLLDGHRMKDAIIRLFPVNYRRSLDLMATDMDRSLQAFFKGQLVLGVLFGLVMLIVYFLLGVQYALLLSAFLAICEILPVIGPPIGFAPAIVAVAVHGSILPGQRFVQIILLAVIFMVLQQVKDSVIAPRYMGNVIGMHPVMIFIAIMIGARIDGMLGIIISLPVASVLTVMLAHLPLRSRDSFDATPTEPLVAAVATAPEKTQGVGPSSGSETVDSRS
jgi:predicted PurR-regulated permease PerM